jgi:hypothetical protein
VKLATVRVGMILHSLSHAFEISPAIARIERRGGGTQRVKISSDSRPIIAASKEVIHGISGITVRRRSQAFFDSIDPKWTSAPLAARQ